MRGTSFHHCLLIFTFLLLSSVNATCESSFYFTSTECTFNVNFTDNECFNMNFINCAWEQCNNRTYDSQGNQICLQYVTSTDASWFSCTQNCCDSSKQYPKNGKGIQQCMDDLNHIENKTLMIALITCGSIVGITIIILICCLCRRKECTCYLSSRQCCRTACEYAGLAIITVCHWTRLCFISICKCMSYVFLCECCTQAELEERSQSISEPTIQIVSTNSSSAGTIIRPLWKSGGANQKLTFFCAICLQASPSLILECGHVYHRQCIIQCIRNKQQCVLCQCPKLDLVLVYCQQCNEAYYEANLLVNINAIDSSKQICDQCREVNLNVVTEQKLGQ